MALATTSPGAVTPEGAAGDGTALARGSVFGRYVILDVLGEGGMGTVFAAHDGSLDRTVALKIVRHERPDRDAQARLVREAKAMARVQHPAIVAVHDVGSVGSRVFIAMELVPGTTLRGWLERAPRSWRDVVRVFVEAGRGLEAAHAAGVIHRDFKPENVLVDEAGRVRVTDFGLADLIAGESVTSASAGTPWYMAPEQHLRRTLDARSDQFSFCVALWQALYGRHPYAAREDELVAAVTAGVIQPAPDGPPRWLAGVLRRGLAVDPAARYPAMSALVDELERRARARRTLVPIAVTVVALAASGGALALASRGAGGPACDAAGARAAEVWSPARRTAIAGALAALDRGARDHALAMLDDHVRRWTEQRVEACRATHVRGVQSGALLDLRMQCLDRRLGEVDALARVLATAERSVVANAPGAVQSLIPLSSCTDVATLSEVVPLPPDPKLRERVAQARAELAAIKADQDTGRYARAFSAAETVARDATAIGYPPLIAEAELMLGSLAWRTDRMDAAEAALYRSIASGEAGRAGDVTAQAWLELLWFVSQERKRLDEALRLGRLAEGAVARYAGDPALAAALAERLGVIALDLGKLDDAAPQLQRAYDLRREHLGDGDPTVAASLQHLALLATARGDHTTAIERHRRAYDTFAAARGLDHPETLAALNGLAAALSDAGRVDESLALLERGLAAIERTVGPDASDAAMYRFNIGLLYAGRGRFDEALAMQRRALEIVIRIHGEASPDVATHRAGVARTLRRAGRHDEAIAAYALAIPAIERTSGRDSADAADTLAGLGRSLIAAKRPREAADVLARAVAIFERGTDPDATREARADLARARGMR